MILNKYYKKATALILTVIVALGCIIGGAIAYLSSQTEKVENTFTIGNIDISLAESENLELKLIPKTTITKDPKITVAANSVDNYLYVHIEKSSNLDTFISYEVADGWLPLGSNYPDVYYREVSSSTSDITFSVLKNDCVTVNDVDKPTMDSLTNDNLPTLSFTGYAIQKVEIEDAVMGWGYLTDQFKETLGTATIILIAHNPETGAETSVELSFAAGETITEEYLDGELASRNLLLEGTEYPTLGYGGDYDIVAEAGQTYTIHAYL